MHKTAWDVLLSSVAVVGGMGALICYQKSAREKARWFRQLGWILASLGAICSGIGRIALQDNDLSILLFTMMACCGMLVGAGAFQGVRLCALFPTFFHKRPRNRGVTRSPESGTDNCKL